MGKPRPTPTRRTLVQRHVEAGDACGSVRVSLIVEPPLSFKTRNNMAEIAVEATEIPAQLPHIRVAVLGAGKMGGILLQAFLKQNLFAPDQIFATVGHAERAVALSTQWGVNVSTDNLAAAKQADLILIGVKPFQVPDLIEEIRPALTTAKTLISFAASVKTRSIEDGAGLDIAVIRA